MKTLKTDKKSTSKGNKTTLIVLVVIFLLAVAFGVYSHFKNKEQKLPVYSNTPLTFEEQEKNLADLAKMNSMTEVEKEESINNFLNN